MIGGIHLPGKKEASLITWTIRRPKVPPSRVRIPLNQFHGAPPRPCVKPGTRVLTGEKIAVPDGYFSVALHASVSGTVKAVGAFPHPIFGEAEAIEIESDGRDAPADGIGKQRPGWADLEKRDLAGIFQDSGLVGLGAAPVPVHVKCRSSREQKVRTLIINACESEPYVTADHALLMAHPLEILKGADILRRALDAEKVVVAIEDNKLEAAELLKSKIYFLKWDFCEIVILPTLYPQGEEGVLARTLAGPRAGTGGSIVLDAAVAYAAHDAVVLQKPLYERVVTVAGECVIEPGNVWARIGESFDDVMKTCRGLMREPRKLLMGGPMTGIAQISADVPVIKGTQAVLALPKEVAKPEKVEPCIRCGRCTRACPAQISPAMITLAAEKGLIQAARDWGVAACIECGNCSYVCPSKRPMTELIGYALSELNLKKETAVRS